MYMSSESIFAKYSTDAEDYKLTLTTILDTIPKGSLKEPIKNWENKYITEWRWRFLNINDDHKVEISRQDKNKKRLYLNKTNNWVERYIDPKYDQYVTLTYYYYASS